MFPFREHQSLARAQKVARARARIRAGLRGGSTALKPAFMPAQGFLGNEAFPRKVGGNGSGVFFVGVRP